MLGKGKFTLLQITYFISLCFFYRYVVFPFYMYTGYFSNQFSYGRLAGAIFVVCVCLGIHNCIKGNFYRITIEGMMFFMIIPSIVFIIFNEISFATIIIQMIPILGLLIVSRRDNGKRWNRKTIALNNQNIIFIFYVLLVMMVPFYLKLDTVNLGNLLFKDVYDARAIYSGSLYLGYMAAPLSKIFLPILTIHAIDNKKRFLLWFALFNICVVYLTTGAQKDVLIGIVLIIICYVISIKKNYSNCINYITLGITALIMLCTILFVFYNELFISTYLRRLLFVAPALAGMYYNYFSQNSYTYYSHTRIGSILLGDEERFILTRWAGVEIVGTGTNANIGVFLEGYISFGFIGVVLSTIGFCFICYMINKMDINKKYVGLWVATLYLFNFSLMDVLLLTHGLLALLFVFYFIVPKNNYSLKEDER